MRQLISRFLSGVEREYCVKETYSMSPWCRAPTDAQGSEGIKSVFDGQMDAVMDGARRAFSFSVRLAETSNPREIRWRRDWSTVLKTLYEFESGWTTSTVERSPASLEE